MIIFSLAANLGAAQQVFRVHTALYARKHRIASALNMVLSPHAVAGALNALVADGAKPDLFYIGLSSTANESAGERYIVDYARENGTPCVVQAHDHQSWARPEVAHGDIISHVRVILASEAEAEDCTIPGTDIVLPGARSFGYREAVFLGGLPIEEEFPVIGFAEPIIVPGKQLFLIIWNKNDKISCNMLEAVLNAIEQHRLPVALLIKLHPNPLKETVDPKRRETLLARAAQYCVGDVEGTSTSLLPRVYAAIGTGVGTDGPHAAKLRCRYIWYQDPDVDAYNISQIGTAHWYPALAGAVLTATPETMATVIQSSVDERLMELHHKRQAQVYTAPDHGAEPPVLRIARYLEEVAAATASA
ncbi:MAG: hypothetical protein Q8R13_05155 [bacterium]|nr:hypothetical protein [bacterium]MDZ4295799.1 hypothetical protein [Patescibacteria group bacterium]